MNRKQRSVYKKDEKKGITLISLVITIIVLLILAGITLNLTLGNRGIFKIATMASKNYMNVQEDELVNLAKFSNEVNNEIKSANIDESTLKPSNNKHEIIYIGELNYVTGNNGVVTSTFDIKEIYEDYKNLTIDNFVYRVYVMYDHWDANCRIIGGHTLKQSYNAETGILVISNAYQVTSFNSGFEGRVYLIPNIETIK